MKHSSCATLAISVMTVAVLGEITLLAANKCCRGSVSDPDCAGCVEISDDPPEHVQAGANTVNHCEPTLQTMDCDESPFICVSLTNAPLYSDSGCSTSIGTITVDVEVGQCDGGGGDCDGAG